jgi:hypothetical protein
MTETQTIDSVCSDQRKRVYELREISFLNEEKILKRPLTPILVLH